MAGPLLCMAATSAVTSAGGHALKEIKRIVDTGDVFKRGMSLFVDPNTKKEKRLPTDETQEENLKFIQERVPGCEVTLDMPPLHERCTIDCEGSDKLKKLDPAMQEALADLIEKVKAVQENQKGFVSAKQLQKIMESECCTCFKPLDKDVTSSRNAYETSGLQFSPLNDEAEQEWEQEAEQVMKDTLHKEGVEEDTWDNLQIDKKKITKIFADRGVHVTNVEDILHRQKKLGHIAIDIGAVRLPRLEDPILKIYRFRVIVFTVETALVCVNNRRASLFTDFWQRSYQMTDEWTKAVVGDVLKKSCVNHLAKLLGETEADRP